MATKFSMHKVVSMARPVENIRRRVRSKESQHIPTREDRGTRRCHQILYDLKIDGVANL